MTSVADIFEDYVESLQNLPSEIDQNMQELRSMDEEFQRFKDIYTKHRRTYAKLYKALNNNNVNTATESNSKSDFNPSITTTNLATAKEQIEKDYSLAIQKQDQKIELTKRMYELVNRHIERIDSQMTKSDLGGIDWIGSTVTAENSSSSYGSNAAAMAAFTSTTISHKITQHPDYSGMSSTLKKKHTLHHNNTLSGRKSRTHHSSRPNPALLDAGILFELDSDPYEPKYCYCNQVSYGDMVACDGENCEKEWFHYACVGLTEPPMGKWYCDYCSSSTDSQQQGQESGQERYRKKMKKEHTTAF